MCFASRTAPNAHFWKIAESDRTFRSGSPTPTVERTATLTNHGATVYVTPAEKRLVDQLETFMFIGIPAAIATAFFLQFVLKVRFNELR